MIEKNLRKIIKKLLLIFYMLKKTKYIMPMFQNISQIVKTKLFLMIPNGEEWYYFAVKRLSALLGVKTSKHDCDFYCLNCFHYFAIENKHESHKKSYVKIKIFVKL